MFRFLKIFLSGEGVCRDNRKNVLSHDRKTRIDLNLTRIGLTPGHQISRINIESQFYNNFFPKLWIGDLMDLDEVSDDSAKFAGPIDALARSGRSAVLPGAPWADGMLRRVV